jgi:hypothetical protein
MSYTKAELHRSEGRSKFESALTAAFTHHFATNSQYANVAEKNSPREYAHRFASAVLDCTGRNDGAAVRDACKALGIKNSYKAMHEFMDWKLLGE